jgi:UDP-N-acetyl-D-mannosaminuronic acid dehydrogenase
VSTACVHGLGHVGLPLAALLAEAGHEVTGCDPCPARVAKVHAARGGSPEPGLDALLARAVGAGRLRAQAQPVAAAFHIIAVPTPLGAGQAPGLRHVEQAADAIAPLLRAGDTVILESTVPVGTTEALAARLAAARPGLAVPGEVHIAHCPERVLPGRLLHELADTDRVIGGLTPACAEAAASLYRDVVRAALLPTTARVAEFVKLAENAFRDVNIAFANELAAIAAKLGVDVPEAIALAKRHPRVDILSPGAGVGGHCIAVDPWFLVAAAPTEARLIAAARAVNDAVPGRIVAQVKAAASRFAAPRIACLGLAYKPDVADLRESPAVAIVAELLREGFAVIAADPFAAELPATLGGVPRMEAEAAVGAADIVAILVAHTPFRALDPGVFAGKTVVDAVGLFRR